MTTELDAQPGPDDATDLATYIAGKLCHDFISPSGAIVSGLDLLKDPSAQDMREEAMSLIQASADKLVALVQFARVAFGASTTSERFSGSDLEPLARGVFAGLRAELDWRVGAGEFSKPQARALLNLAQIAGAALPGGGVAAVETRIEDGRLVLEATSTGTRARLKPEAATGLAGERLTEGLAGQWIQPYWLWRTVNDAGGALDVELGEDRVRMTARMPV